MTNAQIIFSNRVFLMEQGVIKGIPGTALVWKDEQGEREIEMPEEIRTFDDWKRLGFIVQKGQHAVAKFKIWMPKKGKKAEAEAEADADPEKKEDPKGFYKKMSFFFTSDQVKAMQK